MTNEDPQSFPLQWPIGRPRTKYPTGAPFRQAAGRERVSISTGARRVVDELRRFAAEQVVISSNVRPTLSGMPSRETPASGDAGVAVFFRLDGRPHCIACDKWDRVADNLAAIAAHIEAVRGQLRWGCGQDAAQIFAGFLALPAMEPPKKWFEVLGFDSPPTSATTAEERWLELITREHPDRGGNSNRAAEINAAWQQGRIALGVE